MVSVACLFVSSLLFVTASSQDAVRCPISYLVSASDVLSNVQVLSNSPISFVQDVVSFRTVWCTTQLPVGNYFTLTFSEQVVINRIRVSGFQSAYISDFSLLVQENATSTLNPFNQFLVSTSNTASFAVPNVTALFLRFLVNSAVMNSINRYCWHINVFGCRSSEAVVATPTASSTGYPLMPSSSSPAMMSFSASQPSSSTPALTSSQPSSSPTLTSSPTSCQDTTANPLAIAMLPTLAPLAVLILLLVVTTVIIAILAVVLCKTRRRYKSTSDSTANYDQRSRISSLTLPNNVLYGESPHLHENGKTASGADHVTDPQEVPTYEAVLDGGQHGSKEEMVDNPMYGQVSIGSQDNLLGDLSTYPVPRQHNLYYTSNPQ